MASVKQMRKDGPYYLCYKMPTGKIDAKNRPVFRRVQQPSGLYDKNDAETLARAYETVAEAAALKHYTEATARKFLDTIAVITNVDTGQTLTTRQHIHRWFDSRKPFIADKTKRNYQKVIDDFLLFTESRNLVSLATVTHNVVRDFRDQEVLLGKSAATINKALSILGQAFESAVMNQVMRVNPARGLRIKGKTARPQTRRAFSLEEFATLIKSVHPAVKSRRGQLVHPDWETFLLILGYTGGRQQEVAKLAWSGVDFENKRIGLKRTKSDDVHHVPIHPALQRHLMAVKRRTKLKTGPVMPHIAQQTGRTLSKCFRETVLPRMGISQPYQKRAVPEKVDLKEGESKAPAKVGRKLAEYSLHSLRHSLSTWLNARGVPEMTRMRLVGHEDVEISRDYTSEDHAQMTEALLKIPDLRDVTPAPRRAKKRAVIASN
jgi:integrase